jgi:hypothetical protein
LLKNEEKNKNKKKEKEKMIGNKDLDYEVLYKLDDYDLGNMCKVNKYTRELCRNDTFWMNRTINRFLPVFSSVEKIKEFKGDSTWRNYYIDIINFMEAFYQNKSTTKREDFSKIEEYIKEKTEKYKKCIYCSLNWTKEDFLDLNDLFETSLENKYYKIIGIFFQIPRFHISERSIMFFMKIYDKEGIQILLKYKNNAITRKKIMKELIMGRKDYDIFPYVESFQEILDVLYYIIEFNYISIHDIDEKIIEKYLDESIKRGARKKNFVEYEKMDKLRYNRNRIFKHNMIIIKKILKEKGIILKERIARKIQIK